MKIFDFYPEKNFFFNSENYDKFQNLGLACEGGRFEKKEKKKESQIDIAVRFIKYHP